MANQETSSSTEDRDFLRLLRSLPDELRAKIMDKTLRGIALDDSFRYQAVIHRKYGDQGFEPECIHPQYPYMAVIRPCKYSFPAPLLAMIRCLLGSHTVAIELETHYLKQILGISRPVSAAQVHACRNLLRFLQWFRPLSDWTEAVKEKTGCIIIICNRRQQINDYGEVEYIAHIVEELFVPNSVHRVGGEETEDIRRIYRRLWEINNGETHWKSGWGQGNGTEPWQHWTLDYFHRVRAQAVTWYLGLGVYHLMRKWRTSRWVRECDNTFERVRSYRYPFMDRLPSSPPRPDTVMPTGRENNDDDN